MSLSKDLVSQLAKITNDKTEIKKETTVYGTAVEHNDQIFVRIDGSELLTPVDDYFTTADIKDGERVTVMIKNHTATVTGNLTSPSGRNSEVKEVKTVVEELDIDGLTTRITTAENDILDAAKTATDFLGFSDSGLVIGDMMADTLGKNILIDSDSVDIRSGTDVRASFGEDYLYLAKHSRDAKIDLCDGLAQLYHEIDSKGYSVFNIDTTYGLSYIKMSAPMHDLLVLENTNRTNGVIIKGVINGTTVGGFGLVRDGYMVRYGSDADDDNPVEYAVLDTGNFLTEMDDGWHYTGGYGDNFTQYNNEEYAKARYRKIGGTVEIRGVMRPTTIIAGSTTQYELFQLPEGYRPGTYIYQRCSGSYAYSWLLTISPSGKVSFSRYGNGSSYVDVDTTAWLPFQITFFIN